MHKLVIVGAGGHGRETLDVVEAVNAVEPRYDIVGIVADHAEEALLARRGVVWLGSTDVLVDTVRRENAHYHLAIGSSAARARIDKLIVAGGLGGRGMTLVHPQASWGSELRLGPGLFMAAGSRLTTNIALGRHVQVNVNAAVSHDVIIGDHVTLSPGALVNGNVTLGDGVFLGTGAIVLPGRTVGVHAVIGAGAVVCDDVPPGVTAKGVPARW